MATIPLPFVEELTLLLGGCRLLELLDEDWLEDDVSDDGLVGLVELAEVEGEVWSVVDAVPGMVAAPIAPNMPTAATAAAPAQKVSRWRS